jgi:hypothetical protein
MGIAMFASIYSLFLQVACRHVWESFALSFSGGRLAVMEIQFKTLPGTSFACLLPVCFEVARL